MSPFLTAVEAVGHYSAALPLLACLALQLSKREDPSPDAWLLASAFAVSFIADGIGEALAAQGRTNWWLGYIYAPLQFGLLAGIVAQHRAVRAVTLLGIAALAVVSTLRFTFGYPETTVQVMGGLLVGWLVLGVPELARFRAPLLIYCVAAIPWLIGMAAIPYTSVWWDPVWVAYQLTRIMALWWMMDALVRKEVPRGPRITEDHPQRGWLDVATGGRDRDVMEAQKR